MVNFENFVKLMPPSLSESKVTPIFCFPFKIPDDPPATTLHTVLFDMRIFFHYVVVKENLSMTIFYIAVVMHPKSKRNDE